MDQVIPEPQIQAPMNVMRLSHERWGRFAMWLFLASDGSTFGGLLIGYGVLRIPIPDWPNPMEHLAFSLGLAMTALLLASSFTMIKAVAAAKADAPRQFSWFLGLTILAGTLFLALQAYEWIHLLHNGMTMSRNPWGASLFGATFYTLTGFHGLHVLAGVIYLSCLWLGGKKRADLTVYSERVEIAGLYWHFVDIVWVFVFTTVYLWI